MNKICVICGAPFTTESTRKETCRNKVCRKKRKSQISHREQREKLWIKCRSRLQDRHKAILKRAGVKVDKVGLYLKASTRRLKIHLKNQFVDGMSWKNYGFNKVGENGEILERGWVVDHRCPCIVFNVADPEHLKVLWSLENLRPEWHTINLQKHDDIDLSVIPPALRAKVEALGIKLE